MTTNAEASKHVLGTYTARNRSIYYQKYTVGGTGAITAAGGDGYVALTRSDTGTYTGTFPSGGADAIVKVYFKSSTVRWILVEAVDASAGTFSLQCESVAGDPGTETDTELANGDVIWVEVEVREAA